MPDPVPSVPGELVEVATEAVVQTHHDEQMAFLRGEFPANQWRPEKYARAVLAVVSEARAGEAQASLAALVSETGWVRAGDLAELRLDYESLSASVAERIRRRDEAIMDAVRLERERDEARAQADALADALERMTANPRHSHPGRPAVSFEHRTLESYEKAMAALRAYRESQEPDRAA